MKLHKRILSAVAAFLVLTSAVDLTQIAQLSVVAAADTVGDEATGENGTDGKDDENDEDNEDGGDGNEDGDDGNEDGDDGNQGNDNKSDITITFDGLKYLIPGGSSNATVKGLAAEFTKGELVIPSKVTNSDVTYTVTAIAANAFDGEDVNCEGITSVVIPKGITTIGRNAFYGCTELESVELPGSLTLIEYYAFRNCPIDTIKFNGTEKQWNDLIKDSDLGIQTSYNVNYSDDTDPDEPDPSETVDIDLQGGYYKPESAFTQNTNIILHGNITLSGTIRVESGNVTIIGNGHTITRHADFSSTMFLVDKGATLTINNVTIDGNNAKANSAAIYNKGTLYINNSVVKNNRNTAVRTLADDNEATNALFVGGIANDGTLELTNSAVYGNTADGNQSNVVAEYNNVNKATTIINSGIIVGEIDGVTRNNVNGATLRTDAEGEFTVTNGTHIVSCTNGDFIYANPTGLKAIVNGEEKNIDYDNNTWSFYVNEKKPADKLTWDANSVINALDIDNDTEITLNGNVSVNGVIHIKSGNVIINGGNKTISRNAGFLYTMFLVDKGASLTINDVTFDGNNKVNAYSAIIVNDGTLTANNCVFKNNNNTSAKTFTNALNVGGVANNGTLVLNNCAAFNNKSGDDEQSNVKSDNSNVTIYGGLIVGDIGSNFTTAESGTNRVSRGTIETNAKGTFSVTNGTKTVECKNGDVLYAYSTGLTAKTPKETKTITYENSKWKFTVADEAETIEWEAGTTKNGLTITKNTEIKIVPSENTYPSPTSVTLNGTITIKSGATVIISGDGFTIARGNSFKDTMFAIEKDATVVIKNVIFDGKNVEAQSAIIVNNGGLGVDNCVFTNNKNTAAKSNDVGGIANFGTLKFRNSSAYGNTANKDSQSNVKALNGSTTDIESGLIVGEIDAGGKATINNSMRKGTVNAVATDYFEVTNGTNTVKVKIGDILYANPTGLKATIGNKTFSGSFENSKWIFSDECIITYQLNGGTITGTFENPKSYQYGAKVQFPTLTRNGYTFGGWYEDSLFAFPVKDTANVTATGNRTYYAKWTQNPNTNQPGTNQPGTNQPGTNLSGTNQPGNNDNELINKGVIVGTNAPNGVIASTLSDLIRYVLTNADIEALENNKKIDISLGITNINGSAPQADRAVIEEFLRTLNDYRLGYLLDLKLYKTVGSDLYTVKETSGEITLSINVPETLKASGRTFGIVRVHNGAATFLPDTDSNAGTITFKTDKFSTYAIVYKDGQSGSNNPGTPNNPSNPNGGSNANTNPDTGNRTSPVIAIAPVASSLTLVATAKRKKKEEQ